MGGGDSANWTEERLRPLAEFVYSLETPAPAHEEDPAQVAVGATLFETRGCRSCHDGPRSSGRRLYSFDEIGTDRALAAWLDPGESGTACCGARLADGQAPTHALKSPRLNGLWAQTRFLHNGALASLEELFCLDGPRPSALGPALGTEGHPMTCALERTEKLSLIAYLRADRGNLTH